MNKPDIDDLQRKYRKHAVPFRTYTWGTSNTDAYWYDPPGFRVLAAQHGNESAGVEAIAELLPIIEYIQNATFVAMVGNDKAYKMDPSPRYVEEDMNRVWAKVLKAQLTGDTTGLTTYESQRAFTQIAPYLVGARQFFDIHSIIKDGDPMILCPNDYFSAQNLQLLAQFGIPTFIAGKGLLPRNVMPVYADSYVSPELGVTVEAGPQFKAGLGKKVADGLKNILAQLGMLPAEVAAHGNTQEPLDTLNLFDAYRNVGYEKDFTFEKDWQNGQEIAAGTLIAQAPSGPIKSKKDLVIFFAKSQKSLDEGKVAVGDEVCILTKPSQVINLRKDLNIMKSDSSKLNAIREVLKM